jgi:hypothetical protein
VSGGVGKDLLGWLIGDANHEVDVTILNVDNEIGKELMPANKRAPTIIESTLTMQR